MKPTCFGRKLSRILGGIIVFAMAFGYYACKPINPNTPHPDDPIIDTTIYPDTIIVPFKWSFSWPNEDTIEFYKDKNGVKVIVMQTLPLSDEEQMSAEGLNADGNKFITNRLGEIRARAPDKCIGAGDISFNRVIGHPPADSATIYHRGNIWEEDFDALAFMGFRPTARFYGK